MMPSRCSVRATTSFAPGELGNREGLDRPRGRLIFNATCTDVRTTGVTMAKGYWINQSDVTD